MRWSAETISRPPSAGSYSFAWLRPASFARYIAEAKESKDKGKDKPDKDKGKAQEMPPGLAQMDQLPPGLQRHLEKYGTLPPGLEKRRLPGDLESLLPRARPGTERVIVDGDVFLIQKATGLVLDILLDVIK